MKLKVMFTNELPFMIQLPNDDYVVKVPVSATNEIEFTLNLSDKMYRLHTSPFADAKYTNYIEGKREELENYIISNRLPNYAFSQCKSYITCIIEEDIIFNQEKYNEVKEEDLISRLQTQFIQEAINNKNPLSKEESIRLAKEHLKDLNSEKITELKENYLVHKMLGEFGQYGYLYQVALNKFIKLYSDIRNDFFVETLTMHTLEGILVSRYIDDKLYDVYKIAGKMPSIMPYEQWMPPIESPDLTELKTRLTSNYEVPATIDLLLMAKNLCERGEYRSAIINSSAALEVAVEHKIIEKMTNLGKTQAEIDTYLDLTKMNFYQRADSQLKSQTGKSLVSDNSSAWSQIDSHRKKYRHKIAHSSLMPTAHNTEKAINDFEAAVKWVEAL